MLEMLGAGTRIANKLRPIKPIERETGKLQDKFEVYITDKN